MINVNTQQAKPKIKKKLPDKVPTIDTPVAEDGVNCINIHIDGKTQLGKMLSFFYESHFVHPYFGPFNCMEGFWHYIKTAERDDNLRHLVGLQAKKHGDKLTKLRIKNFHEIIIAANFHKIQQNPKLKELFLESTLPFDYFYHFGPGNLLIRPAPYTSVVRGFETLRTMMKEGRVPEPIDYGQLILKS